MVSFSGGLSKTGSYDELKAATIRLAGHCRRYAEARTSKALVQLANTLLPFVALLVVAVWGASVNPLISIACGIPAGGLLVRLFIIQHDCGHGSFLASKTWNNLIGRCLSLGTLTPYGYWRRSHTLHHASSGNLNRRGIGDVTTLTVEEYRSRSVWNRVLYRIYRNPLVLIVIGAPLHFVLLQRLPFANALPGSQSRYSIMALNLGLVAVYGGVGWLVGPWITFVGLLPTIMVGAWAGVWLFFVQHQFEETVWDEGDEWDQQVHALIGSSYFVMPKILQWFTGNIGLHHVHHLNSRIPNYRLQECIDSAPELGSLNRMGLLESFRCTRLALWDEASRRLIGFGDLAHLGTIA
jgi:omega-6 fatty acid desaturase (delta-12 desaturase)